MKPLRITDFDPNAQPPSLGSPMDSLPTIQRPPTDHFASMPANPQSRKPVSPHVGKPANRHAVVIENNKLAESYKLNNPPVRSNSSIRRKFTSVIRPDYKKRLKRIAFDRDCDPCDVLEEALTSYFDSLDERK